MRQKRASTMVAGGFAGFVALVLLLAYSATAADPKVGTGPMFNWTGSEPWTWHFEDHPLYGGNAVSDDGEVTITNDADQDDGDKFTLIVIAGTVAQGSCKVYDDWSGDWTTGATGVVSFSGTDYNCLEASISPVPPPGVCTLSAWLYLQRVGNSADEVSGGGTSDPAVCE